MLFLPTTGEIKLANITLDDEIPVHRAATFYFSLFVFCTVVAVTNAERFSKFIELNIQTEREHSLRLFTKVFSETNVWPE